MSEGKGDTNRHLGITWSTVVGGLFPQYTQNVVGFLLTDLALPYQGLLIEVYRNYKKHGRASEGKKVCTSIYGLGQCYSVILNILLAVKCLPLFRELRQGDGIFTGSAFAFKSWIYDPICKSI